MAWWDSRLPGTYDVHSMGAPERGGGTVPGAHHHSTDTVAVTALTEEGTAPADARFSLTARAAKVQLRDGSTVEGYTLNATTPGPELRVRQSALVEVTLHNEDVQGGATLHWHGLDVPNAMDGVAGITQDAVRPGESFTYRFVARQVGTYWYRSHQLSHRQVLGGLFGALVVEPHSGPLEDAVMVLHTYPGSSRTVNGSAAVHSHSEARPGSTVRVRVINTENVPMPVWVAGSDFRVLAIDGTDVHAPTVLDDQKVLVTAGGRTDVEVTVPAWVRGVSRLPPSPPPPPSSIRCPTARPRTWSSIRPRPTARSVTTSGEDPASSTVRLDGGGRSTVTWAATSPCSWWPGVTSCG